MFQAASQTEFLATVGDVDSDAWRFAFIDTPSKVYLNHIGLYIHVIIPLHVFCYKVILFTHRPTHCDVTNWTLSPRRLKGPETG